MTQVALRQDLAEHLEQLAQQQQCSLDEVVEALLATTPLNGRGTSPLAGGPFDEQYFESEAFSHTVIASMAEGVVLETPDGRIQFCNASAERILGLTAEQIIGRSSQDPRWRTLREDGLPFSSDAHPVMITLRTGEARSNVIMGVHKPDDTLTWISINTQPISQPGSTLPEAVIVTFVDITELKQKELALKETHEQLTTILAGTADGIMVLDPGARVIYANDRAAHMFGRESAGEMLHKSRHELLDRIEVIDEFGQPLLEEQLPGHLALKGHQPDPVTASFCLPDIDEQQWHVIKATPIFDDLGNVRFAVIATHNITERKKNQASLEQERSLLRVLIDHLPDLVYVKDLDSRFLISNASHTSLLGCDREDEILGRTVADFVPSEFAEAYAQDDHHVLHNGNSIINREERIIYADGRLRWLLTTKAPLRDAAGKTIGLIGISRDFTDHMKAEDALRRSEVRNRAMLEAVPDLMFRLSKDGTHLDFYAPSENQLYASPEAFLDKQVEDVLPTAVAATYQSKIQETLTSGEVQIFEYRLDIPGLGGQDYEARMVVSGVDEVLAIVRNITDRRQIQATLEQERSLLRTLIDHLPDQVYVKDRQSRYLVSNTAFSAAMGCQNEDEVLGKVFADFVSAEFAESSIQDDRQVIHHGETILNVEGQIVYPDGRSGWLLTTKVPLHDSDGKISGLIGIGRDITDRKEAEAQAVALTIERERAQVLSDFIQDASHEFRTPLSVINTNSYLLERLHEPDRQQILIDGVRDQVTKIVRLVDGLVTMNRLERSTRDHDGRLSLNEVLRVVCYAQQSLADSQGLELTMDLTPYLPTVPGSGEDMALAISEIIENAIRFTPSGGQIIARTYADTDQIAIEVKDTGMGIEPEHLPRIFERFYRGDAAHTTPGFGLGLAISHKIVSDHGGTIEVESTLGEGSLFRVLLSVPDELE